jgi:hypothetical protein
LKVSEQKPISLPSVIETPLPLLNLAHKQPRATVCLSHIHSKTLERVTAKAEDPIKTLALHLPDSKIDFVFGASSVQKVIMFALLEYPIQFSPCIQHLMMFSV